MKLFKRLLAIFLILGIFMLTGYSFDVQISDECPPKGNMAFDFFVTLWMPIMLN